MAQFVACVLAITCVAQAEEESSFDWKSFQAMGARERVDLTLGILDARQKALENIRYEVTQSVENVIDSSQSRRFLHRDQYEFRRQGPRAWIHLTNYEPFKPDGAVRQEATFNWDGKLSRTIVPPTSSTGRVKCRLGQTENDNFAYLRFSELLGFRVNVHTKAVPLMEWLREDIRKGAVATISVADNGGSPYLAFQLRAGLMRWTLLLDPRRQFMTTRFDYRYESGHAYSMAFIEALTAEKVSGVWLPITARSRSGNSSSAEETEIRYQVRNAAIGTVSDADLDIKFPTGSDVIDSVNKVHYLVLADNKFELLPAVDTGTQVVSLPPEKRYVDHIGPDTHKVYLLRHTSPSRPAPRSTWSLSRVAWIISSLVVINLLVFAWYRRQRSRPRPNAT